MIASKLPVAPQDSDPFRFLGHEHQINLLRTEELVERIGKAARGDRRAIIQSIADQFGHVKGFSAKSLYRKVRKWELAGRQRMALVNKACQKRLVTKTSVYHCYKTYCENNQRVSRAGWREMMEDLIAGKILPHGVGDWREVYRRERGETSELPRACPYTLMRPPEGWTYARLQDVAGLTEFEKKASRRGLRSAGADVLPVITTRVGLHCGQFYQFDDQWHDAYVNLEGQSNGVRPLEFVCYDVFSARKVAFCLRPRTKDEETGKHENLNEQEMRFLTAHLVTSVGYHKDGCSLVVEHGTSTIRKASERAALKGVEKMEDRLVRLSEGVIRVVRGGIFHDQVHKGLWAGSDGGNFKLKPMCESLHGLDHNMLANLPAQIGRNRDNCPDQLKHLLAYNADLIVAMAKLPEDRRHLLQSPLLNFTQYASIVGEVYDRIEDRRWHDLEGWEQLGFIVPFFRLEEGMNWKPWAALQEIEASKRNAIIAYLHANPNLVTTQRLSPREVWAAGQADLIRMPDHYVPMLLDWDDGLDITTETNGTIQFRNRYLGPGVHIFHAVVITPEGYQQSLSQHRSYHIHYTPFNLDKLYISDAETRVFLGVAPRYETAPKYDIDLIHRLQGKQAHHRAELSAPIQARHQDEAAQRLSLVAHNDAVISGAPVTASEKAISKRAGKIDLNEELRLERELLEQQKGE
jgi:hypothetical protein